MIEGKDDPRSPDRLMQRRTWTTDREMTVGEFERELSTHIEAVWMHATLGRGVFVSWYSPESDEEVADRLARMAAHDERHAEWERAMYEKLKEKYGR